MKKNAAANETDHLNHAYMNLYLQTIIYKIIADMDNASIHHIIYARYYFFGQRMHGFETGSYQFEICKGTRSNRVWYQLPNDAGRGKRMSIHVQLSFHLILSGK